MLPLAGARGHDLFLDFVGKAFNVPEAYPDLNVTFEEETVYAHKFLLAARAPAIGEACQSHTLVQQFQLAGRHTDRQTGDWACRQLVWGWLEATADTPQSGKQ